MKLLNLGVLSILLGLAGQSLAQSSTAAATRQAKLQNLAEKLQQRDVQDRERVRTFARRHGLRRHPGLPRGWWAAPSRRG